MNKRPKTELQKEKAYNNTTKKTGKWRGKKISEYVKYKKRKKEKINDLIFHQYFGYMLLNPKKYGKKWMEKMNKLILQKKGGYEALKRVKRII